MRVLAAIVVSAVLILPASAYAAQRRAPYTNLFTGQLNVTPAQPPASLPALPMPQTPLPTQTVVCGMTVVQGDSKLDPKMPQRPPANAPKPTIRIFPAPACQK
jgi:hypothetical protein